MLVNANTNNLEAVQAVSHMLYVCTYLYVLCTDFSLTWSIFVVFVVMYIISNCIQNIYTCTYIHVIKEV